MDIWSKLIAGSFIKPATASKASSDNPDKRLARLKREYHQLLQIWRNSSNLSKEQDTIDSIRRTIQELTSIISDENTRPSPHLCISFASSKQIYVTVGKIATTSYSESIIQEAVALFKKLIECDEEDFLGNISFSKSVTSLLSRITGANGISLSPDTQVKVVELAFNIAAKIKLEPEILPAWFTSQINETDQEYRDEHEIFAGKTHKEDFPLFYLLIDSIHEDGPAGEFARTGLLYIIESAPTSVSLEQWLVESDLATLMATGLGALYGRLSRKLVIDYLPDQVPPILALSDYDHPVTTADVVSSTDVDFLSHMDTFLSHLLFWQDVLQHCQSVEVTQTLLEHFQVCFLQQILYPSLLQSSDVDGGSSVAVLTSLRRILESLDHPEMIHLILHYLLALPDDVSSTETSAPKEISAARKRKSMDLANMMASQSEDQATPALFNLVDLILGCLRSKSQQTIGVTLQLVSVILRQHHRYAVTTLLRTARTLSDGPQRTIGAHEREMEFLLNLANEIGDNERFDEIYENLVKDSRTLLESHQCSQSLITPKGPRKTAASHSLQGSIAGAPQGVRSHTLRPDDPMLKTILSLFDVFFINPVEINLCLTEAMVDLASCGFMSLEGWFLPEPTKYTYADLDERENTATSATEISSDLSEATERAQSRIFRRARRTPNWPPSEMPAFLNCLETLHSHILTYRSEIPRFDELLQQRRQAFQSHSEQSSSITIHQQPRSSFDSAPSRSTSPPPSKLSALDSLAQRIFPDLTTPSRSTSPRGRRSQDQQRSSGGFGTPTPVAIPNSGAPRIPPPQFPMGGVTDTPSRGSSRAFSPSPLRSSENHASVSRGIAGQVAALAEVDRTILARRVRMPTRRNILTPLPFPTLTQVTEDDASNAGGEASDDTGSASGYETAASHADDEQEDKGKEEDRLVTVSHILTNVIVLQEFLLEMAALVQVRAGLFEEVRFT